MRVIFTDYDPGTLSGLLLLFVCGIVVVFCILIATIFLFLKNWPTAKRWAAAAAVSAVAAIGLFYGTVLLGRIFHWL